VEEILYILGHVESHRAVDVESGFDAADATVTGKEDKLRAITIEKKSPKLITQEGRAAYIRAVIHV